MALITSRFQEPIFAVTRIVFGLLFMCHGAQKLFGLWGMHSMAHVPLLLVAGILEFVGGLFIALGLFTRPVAFVLCGEMAVAYFKQHFPASPLPIVNKGELAVLYCFFYLYLSVRGAGAFSLDALRKKF